MQLAQIRCCTILLNVEKKQSMRPIQQGLHVMTNNAPQVCKQILSVVFVTKRAEHGVKEL